MPLAGRMVGGSVTRDYCSRIIDRSKLLQNVIIPKESHQRPRQQHMKEETTVA